jgi:uncharacterized protein YdbL (DUF1318 family)
MKSMMIKFSILCFAIAVAFPSTALAIDLDTAKSQNLVGETPSGYLAAVSGSASAEVQQLVAQINSQRRSAYQNIAQSNGTSLTEVEKLAGQKAINNTSPGRMVKLPNGSWVKK